MDLGNGHNPSRTIADPSATGAGRPFTIHRGWKTMASLKGRQAIIEQLRKDGIRYMFGNPGTTEEGFLDALEQAEETDRDIRYINVMEEGSAVTMADGYARATGQTAVIQLHSGVGLGNGVGALYQAKRGHSPLVVLTGDAGLRYDAMDGQMAVDLVGIAKPVTKWATRVLDKDSVLRVLRRALKMAATPPRGPVFVALPMDVLDADNREEIVPTTRIATRSAPEDALIYQAAARLRGAKQPLIIMGDGITTSGAQPELARVAELLGAEVWGANSSEVNMSAANPLFGGLLGHMFGTDSQPHTAAADAVLMCGTTVLPEVFPALFDVFQKGARVVQVDLDAWEIAKNFPVDSALLGDPKLTLGRLADALAVLQSPEDRQQATGRVRAITERNRSALAAQIEADKKNRDAVPLRMSRFAEELNAQLPGDAIIFDEALTHSPELTRYVLPTRPGCYFQTRGGTLGVGLPGAIGVKLAHPDKTVIGFTGDGGALYTFQALWTAAHEKIAAKLVVCNNHSYRLLKLNILEYWKDIGVPENPFPRSFDLCKPDIDFAALAGALGVPGERVETPDQIAPAIKNALGHDGPYLIELVLEKDVPSTRPPVKCGQ
jgi:benzoylformate decarboxylase